MMVDVGHFLLVSSVQQARWILPRTQPREGDAVVPSVEGEEQHRDTSCPEAEGGGNPEGQKDCSCGGF